jgi:hypothetical protein
MMKKYLIPSILIQLIVLITSCESDINMIYESQGKPVVYCLLNPKDSVQYLRVSRSFIFRGNPGTGEISPDSLILDQDFYAYLELEKPDGTRDIHYFEITDLTRRDSGLFPVEGLVIFKTNCKVEGGKEYGLYINFPNLPKLIAGSVTVVNPVTILDPNPLPGREITLLDDQGYLVRWTKSIQFAVYQPVIRFIFLEGNRNFQIIKEVDCPQQLVYGDSENAILTNFVNGAGFLNDLVTNLAPPDSGMQRKIIGFDLLLTTGGPELSVFIRSGQNAVASFTGLDEYSNLDGAVGIYASQTFSGTFNNRFSDLTINYLAGNEKTRHLGFLKFNEDFHP